MVVPLYDFDVILGVDFMLLANAMVMPYLNGLFIADQNSTCFVQGTYLPDSVRSVEKKNHLILAMQMKAGLRHGEQTYLVALIKIKPDVIQEVPDEEAELLQEFKDIFPPELPKKLPPWQAIDHVIELEPGARLPASAPYRMAPTELAGRAVGGRADLAIQSIVWFSYFVPKETRWFDENVCGLSGIE
ncbi:UNVERIFIED_CONTAM: hypothetical protein Sangu_2150600 [Sesamum angustifolium]|uniref:Uncharacterized protein n=1 Tax=Sesamum angustifolium TaxID=2727405 RepID=A0AAW2LGM9_9LAMI